jgi:hypothetical protein
MERDHPKKVQYMKKENLPPTVSSETQSLPPAREDIQSQWHNVVRRRSFLKGLGMVGATLLPANALLMTQGKAQEAKSAGKLTKGDADLLRFAAWAEVVESDLWTNTMSWVEPQHPTTAQLTSEIQLTNLRSKILIPTCPSILATIPMMN